jgi:thioester reductase-like protein/acyl carrier protein
MRVTDAFAETLRAILQVNTSDEDLMASRSSDIGLDSLVSVNIRSWFLKHLQVGIPVLKIMGNDTMGNLVKLAVESIPAELVPHLNTSSSSQSSSEENDTPSSVTDEEGIVPSETAKDSQSKETKHGAIDWEAESRPPVDVIDVTQETDKPHPKFPPEVIVLTGSSGLLGHHLLTYLLNRTPVKKVICIAIRNLAERLKNKELPPANPRMEYHEGDLSAPLLGLSADQATSIFAVADAVIHNGADTSHMKGYLDVRASNVGSTIALAKLCLPRRIPLHYVSSVGLAILYGRDEFPPVSIADRALPAADGSFGYASAKWTCERLLERTHEMYKGEWPVCIHRPSTIIREGEDAVGTKANLDWVNALLHYARKSKTVPKIEHNSGALDLVHVENVCTDLVARVMQRNERMAKGEVGYVHEVGDVVLPLDRLAEVGLREENGGEVWEEVRMDVWIQRAVEDGMHPAVAALVEMMDVEGGPKYPRLLKEVHE